MNIDYRHRLYERYVETHLRGVTMKHIQKRTPFLRRVIKFLPKDKEASILDLGCGHGSFLYVETQAGYSNIHSVDISADQVEAAKKLGLKNVRQKDLMLELREADDASYDIIVAIDVIEHMTKSELLDFVDDVFRVLKKGVGRLILHMPNASSPFAGRIRYGDYTHEQAFTQGSLSQVLRAAGFGQIECFEDTPPVHGIMSSIRWILWKCFRTILRIMLAVETGARNEIFSQTFLAVVEKK